MGEANQRSFGKGKRSRIARWSAHLLLAAGLFISAPPARSQDDPQVQSRLRQAIEDLSAGRPNLDQMEPMLRVAVEQQQARMSQTLQTLGRVTNIEYVGPQNGTQVYKVAFERGNSVWAIALSPNGKILTLYFQPL